MIVLETPSRASRFPNTRGVDVSAANSLSRRRSSRKMNSFYDYRGCRPTLFNGSGAFPIWANQFWPQASARAWSVGDTPSPVGAADESGACGLFISYGLPDWQLLCP